jgi:hypothetical protein
MLVQTLGFPDRCHVHDADARIVSKHRLEGRVLLGLIHRASHLEAQIGPRESCDDDARVAHSELSDDVVANFSRGRRGKRENRRSAQPLHDGSKRQIVGAEIVTPLADAVRLIDHEQAHGSREQAVEKVAVLEALWSEIENLAATVGHPLGKIARLGIGEVRVHGKRIYAVGSELVLLILHQ